MVNELKEFGIRFEENVLLKNYCTIKCDCVGKIMVFPTSLKQLKKVVALCREEKMNYFVVGNGSNLVFCSGNFVFIKLCGFSKIKQKGEIFECGACCTLSQVCQKARSLGFSKLEGLFGIPAQIGGATVMNARAFGCEMKNVILKVKCLTSNGKVVYFNKDQCDFDYKQSVFQGKKFIIISVFLRLKRAKPILVAKRMEKFKQQRLKSQPNGLSAGCVFKNQTNAIAGKLIQKCGFAGKRFKNFFVSKKHCNFIINTGKGKAKDLVKFIEKIRKSVYNKTKIILETEVIWVGENETNSRLSHTHKI